MFRFLLLALVLLAPAALAQAPGGAIDATVTLRPDAAPVIAGPEGLVTLGNVTPGERYEFDLVLTKDYTTFEIHANGFDITRPKQIMPSLMLPDTQYPLFEQFPNDEIWDVDGPADVFFTNGTATEVILRLGVKGPRNVTLVIERDVTPPSFVMGEVRDIITYGFYQEVNASEISLGDMQVRKVGATEWVVNPTPAFHFRQRFPIQGLAPDTEYEVRYIVTDWADNKNMSETYTVRSAPAVVGPPITITPISPAPNATVMPGAITVRASVASPESPIAPADVRLFFDKKEVTEGIQLLEGELRYTPKTLVTAGTHSVAIEATNEAGGTGLARWTFEVAGATKDSPLPLAALFIALALVGFARRR